MNKNDVLLKELQKVLNYDPDTGEFRWRVAISKSVKAGSLAGNVDKHNMRLVIRFQGKRYYSYRLAWLLVYLQWPNGVIDHIDGNPLNNRIDNLRDVSSSVNRQNQRKTRSNNKTGFLGVCWKRGRGKFVAKIGSGRKQKHLGYFMTPEEAYTAYLKAKRQLHEGCTI